MKKRLATCFKQALNKLALIAFVSANVIPASADVSSYYTPPAYGTFADPSIIFQNQTALNIYNVGGGSLGQLNPGSVFQTQMMHDPLALVLSQPTLNYPAFYGTAMQFPTAMGPMIPATLEQAVMLNNGTTLPMNSNFYIPPAEFSYEKIQAIGARATDDDQMNRMIADSIFGDDKDSSRRDRVSALRDDDDDEDDDYRPSRASEVSRASSRAYENSVSRIYRTQERAYETPNWSSERQAFDLESNGSFRIVGPTCDCRSKGMACVVTSGYNGFRKATKKTRAHNHAGIDIGGGKGTPIVAAADGRVTVAYRSDSYGNTLDIEHADKYMTRYAHMTKFIVRPGQYVRAGDIIGYMGNTGNVIAGRGGTGVHLHFELCKLRSGQTRCTSEGSAKNGVNPLTFMSSNGSINQNTQLNKSCSALGNSSTESVARSSNNAATSRRTSRAAR